MTSPRLTTLSLAALLLAGSASPAQKLPEAGYAFPPGGKAGTTVQVRLGGYDWTPDIDLFSLESRSHFAAVTAAPPTSELMSRRLGAQVLGVIEVRDCDARLVAALAGTNNADPSLTFAANAKSEYSLAIHSVDLGGDRSYVYRLTL